MSDSDALKTFEFPKGKGLFLTFEDGDEFKLRVLTTDPVVTTNEFQGADGETNLSTRFAFIVFNFTLDKAQILNTGSSVVKQIQKIHNDPDFGADIKQVDIKISATGNKLTRKYTVQVLPKAETLTNAQIKECQAIKLDEVVKDGQRMSFYDPEKVAKKSAPEEPEEVLEDISDDPIDVNDIPF